ncbi:FadR/GntR family transcriptional regulator [Hyalangium minutum]|nr:GntR family transcriptional regulator [Hyalangium minutum]
MERTGLVAHIEHDLEQVISWGKLPRNGFLPSEQVLAERHGVSRATARVALLRLEARGLVVQHPGRRSRAVPLQEAVTLENLSVALHAEGPSHPERQRLLEGFLELKRELMVDLLAACCERASASNLSQLLNVCFTLGEAAHWEESSVWARREFELLRLAAVAANRPGHFLLVQTLERSFWAMAARLLPVLDCAAIRHWGLCAFHALGDKDAQALKRELPALLQASDERVLSSLASTRREYTPPPRLHGSAHQRPERSSKSKPTGDKEVDADHPHRPACQTGLHEEPPEDALPFEPLQGNLPDTAVLRGAAGQTGSREGPSEAPAPSATPPRQLPDAAVAYRSACQTRACQTPHEETPPAEGAQRQLPDAAVAYRSACQTRACQTPPEETPTDEGAQRRLSELTVANQSACQTLSEQVRKAFGSESESWFTRSGSDSGGKMFGAGEGSGLEALRGAQAWSPIPWSRCAWARLPLPMAPALRVGSV